MSRGKGDGGPRTVSPPARDPARHGDTVDMLPERDVQFPPTVHHVHRHPLGLSPGPLLAALAAGIFVMALILLALGSWVAGIVFLALFVLAVGLFVVATRREPEAQTSRLAVTAADRADGFARLTSVALRAWVAAGLERAKLWGRRRRLRFERSRRMAPLGEAVHENDRERAMQLKAQVEELDQAIREAERLAADVMATRRSQIERERATSQSTQQLPVVESDLETRR